jgi:pyruvate/2-oxoacid:ferredoxin oxidoreductase beta subunit
VRTNYFPLWEAENGRFHLTHEVSAPRPIQEYLRPIRKFSHLKEADIAEFQQLVDRNYAVIKRLCAAE